jgi:hypothetical protein
VKLLVGICAWMILFMVLTAWKLISLGQHVGVSQSGGLFTASRSAMLSFVIVGGVWAVVTVVQMVVH